MANILNPEKQAVVIRALAEGNSIRSVERMTGVHRDTVMRLGVRVGEGCAKVMDAKMRTQFKLGHYRISTNLTPSARDCSQRRLNTSGKCLRTIDQYQGDEALTQPGQLLLLKPSRYIVGSVMPASRMIR